MGAVTSTPEITPELKLFLRRARQGAHPGSSMAARRCRRLAQAIVLDSPCLDGPEIAGARQFLRLASSHPEVATRALNLD